MSMAPAAAPPQDDDMETRQWFTSDPAQVGEARGFVLKASGLPDDHPRADDLALCASEIITNAVVHPDPDRQPDGFNVAVTAVAGEVVVTVSDGGGDTVPTIRRGDDSSRTNGRGMLLVDTLADEWGFSRTTAGRTLVWFAIRATATNTLR